MHLRPGLDQFSANGVVHLQVHRGVGVCGGRQAEGAAADAEAMSASVASFSSASVSSSAVSCATCVDRLHRVSGSRLGALVSLLFCWRNGFARMVTQGRTQSPTFEGRHQSGEFLYAAGVDIPPR